MKRGENMKSLLSSIEAEVTLERRRGHYNLYIHNTCVYAFFLSYKGSQGEAMALPWPICVFVSEESDRRFKNTTILTVKDPITEHMPI